MEHPWLVLLSPHRTVHRGFPAVQQGGLRAGSAAEEVRAETWWASRVMGWGGSQSHCSAPKLATCHMSPCHHLLYTTQSSDGLTTICVWGKGGAGGVMDHQTPMGAVPSVCQDPGHVHIPAMETSQQRFPEDPAGEAAQLVQDKRHHQEVPCWAQHLLTHPQVRSQCCPHRGPALHPLILGEAWHCASVSSLGCCCSLPDPKQVEVAPNK